MESLIHRYGPLPPLKLRAPKLVAATGADKKNVGGVRRFVLPVGIGDACVVDIEVEAEEEGAEPRSYSFADAQQASTFVTEAVEALLYLGCEIHA